MDNFSKFIVFFAVALLIQMNGSKADKKLDNLRSEYNEALLSKNCGLLLKHTEQMLLISPDEAHELIGIQYQNGICRSQDTDQAIDAYKSVKKGNLQSPYAFELKRLLFEKASTTSQEKEVLSDIREVIDDGVVYWSSLEGFLSFFEASSAKYPKFYQRFETEISLLNEINNDPTKKTNFALNFLSTEIPKKVQLGEQLLSQLTYENKFPEAAYQLAQHKYKNLKHDEGFKLLTYAAQLGHNKAQLEAGMLRFENKEPSLNRVQSFEMLLRAHKANLISDESLFTIQKKLYDFELDAAKQDAAQPLPAF